MKNASLVFCISLLHFAGALHAQTASYQPVIIGFYNCENLYDTLNDPQTTDEEFLPEGSRRYTGMVYRDKIARLAKVIEAIGTETDTTGLTLLGVAEIENRAVLTDLINHPCLKKRCYNIIHYDSKDVRGVDVALLYHPARFIPDTSRSLRVTLPSSFDKENNTHYTRDILWVKGKLGGETIHIYVNHWPSRLGGIVHSFPARAAAAQTCKKHVDSVLLAEPGAKVLIMGDLNDDPNAPSVTHILRATGQREKLIPDALFNPWLQVYKKGAGTLAYQDAWSLFDQVILSHAFLSRTQNGWFFYRAGIFKKKEMTELSGRYKGYPKRSWDGLQYNYGYSDHFPVYITLLKRLPL